ncbi:hypothetical protein [Stenotrophomonas sepilia]|uniref:hypothetical protein n=1 Tax=Stenotrophomonas sepilia TaxID=2860290 RepID=UPI002E7657CB|nr:hypothetical protein [Stenotrophomonas sepilia]
MAEGGFEIVNVNSNVIIDSTFFNYALISKHTLVFQTAGGPVTGGYGNQAFLTVQGDAPIVAARCAHPFTVCRARPVAGGFEFGFISRHGAGAAPGDTIEVFVFDRPHATGLYGMQTFDGQGRIVYDSTRKYMRVVDFRTTPGASPSAQVRVAGSGQYAYVVTRPAYRWSGVQVTPSSNWQWACSAGFVYSRSDGYDLQSWNSGEGSYAPWGHPAPVAAGTGMDVMVVDVSGL